ncbi:MAG: hypothetical protein ACREBV_09175, partial [Candidatus Zixiibacteriota bacterium]
MLMIAGLSFLLVPRLESSPPDIPYPIDLMIEPVPMPTVAGPVNLRVNIIFKEKCEDAKIAISGIDNLEYIGDTVWNISSNQLDANTLNLNLVIPENDTSGIGLTFSCSKYGDLRWLAFFTAGHEGVKFYEYNPRGFRKAPKKTIDMSDPPIEEAWKHSAKNSPGGYMLFTKDDKGSFVPFVGDDYRIEQNLWGLTHEGEFVPWDSLMKEHQVEAGDATMPVYGSWDRSKTWIVGKDGKRTQVDRQWLLDSLKQAKTQEQLDDMQRREQIPCTLSGERIIVDGEAWQRKKSDYKFQKAKIGTDIDKMQREFIDSVGAVTPDTAYHITLDLRTKADSDFVAGYIDSLVPMDREGFYHARTKREIVALFEKSGIKKGIYPFYPGELPFMPPKKKF